MRLNICIIFSFLQMSISIGQQGELSFPSGLSLEPITEKVYLHSWENSNGMVYFDGNQALIVSTPPSDDITDELITWIKDSLEKEIVAYVIDRWHPDAMEGIDVVHNYKIPTYANSMTCEIAERKGLPIPQNPFSIKKEIKVGNAIAVAHYLGPAHTRDGIVVFLPDEHVLFGGNEIRSFNGWVGNIADAHLDEWSETIKKVKAEYGQARHVIPGHGRPGGPELLEYTINLYTPSVWGELLKLHRIVPAAVFNDHGRYFEVAEKDTLINDQRVLINADLFIDKGEQYIYLSSPEIKITPDNQGFQSEYGRIRILNKDPNTVLTETDGYYKRLFINFRDDIVKMTVVMKELIR